VSYLPVPLKWTNAPTDSMDKYWNVRIATISMKSGQIDFTKRPFKDSYESKVDEVAVQHRMGEMEEKVNQIWQACSAFEEVCAIDI